MKEWWTTATPIYKGEGDGQEYTWVYARKMTKGWEYALVRYFDDGTFQGVAIIKDGKVTTDGHVGF